MNVVSEYKNIIESPLFSLGPIVMFMWKNEEGWPVEAISKNIDTIFSHHADDYLQSKLIYSNQIHPEDLERVGKEVEEASSSKLDSFVHKPYRYCDGNGHYHWVNDTNMILRNDKGEITHYVGYISDITKEIEVKQKLEENNARWEAAVEGNGDGVWDWNMVDNSVYYSKQWKAMLGYDEDEIKNGLIAWKSLVHPDDLEDTYKQINDYLDAKTDYYVSEHRLLCKDGTYKWILDRGCVLEFSPEGIPLQFVGTHSDISKRKLDEKILEDTLSIERAIFENIDYILITTDKNGIVTKFNKKAEELLGYKAEELIGKLSPSMFHVESEVISRAEEFSKELNTNITSIQDILIAKSDRNLDNECEWTYVAKDGHKFPVLLSITAMRNKEGEIRGYIGVGKDITLEKEFQSSLLQAKENAEHSSHSKSQFLANMSHEIRTPLNAIMGFIDLLQKDETVPKKLEYLNIIKGSSKSLLGVINDVLDISKIEDGKLEIELIDFDTREQFNEIIEFFRTSAVQKKVNIEIHFTLSVPEYIQTDLLRVKQIMSNLLSNAIKFSKQNNTVMVNVDFYQKTLEISVHDEGIGITSEAQKRIFKPFEQADISTTRNFGGTGLGLSISKRLAELLGGDISVSSTIGVGSTFKVTLNVNIIDADIIESVEEEEYQFEGHILVAEDNKTNQMLIKILLSDMNLTCDIAEDGVEAVHMYEQKRYELILMDINMPNMDGLQATEFIRKKSDDISKIPIIALTANAMKDDISNYLESGMNAYVSKPIDVNKLAKEMLPFLKQKV